MCGVLGHSHFKELDVSVPLAAGQDSTTVMQNRGRRREETTNIQQIILRIGAQYLLRQEVVEKPLKTSWHNQVKKNH